MSFCDEALRHRPGVHGAERTMKAPKTNVGKTSLPGAGGQYVEGEAGMRTPTVFPDLVSPEDNLLEVVYDHKPVDKEWNLHRVRRGWTRPGGAGARADA